MKSSRDADKTRIVFHSWGIESLRIDAKAFLTRCESNFVSKDINDALEYYNVHKILESDPNMEIDKSLLDKLFASIARFFHSISDSSFA